jgi:hypothetical protein
MKQGFPPSYSQQQPQQRTDSLFHPKTIVGIHRNLRGLFYLTIGVLFVCACVATAKTPWPLFARAHLSMAFLVGALVCSALTVSDTVLNLGFANALLHISFCAALFSFFPVAAIINEISICSALTGETAAAFDDCLADLSTSTIATSYRQTICLYKVNIDVQNVASGTCTSLMDSGDFFLAFEIIVHIYYVLASSYFFFLSYIIVAKEVIAMSHRSN